MKSLASRRTAPERSPVRAANPKKIRLPRAIDVRRWKKLLNYLSIHEIKLQPIRVARLKGLATGSMVSQILQGKAAMNETWMLCIAYECATAPQVIWGDDWPFPEMTPDVQDPELARINRQWHALKPGTRRYLASLAGEPRNPP